jgi:hypothetical protein
VSKARLGILAGSAKKNMLDVFILKGMLFRNSTSLLKALPMSSTNADSIPAYMWLIASIVGVAISVALRFESFPLDGIVRLSFSAAALYASVKWMTRCDTVQVTTGR